MSRDANLKKIKALLGTMPVERRITILRALLVTAEAQNALAAAKENEREAANETTI